MENFKGIYLARQDFICCFHLLYAAFIYYIYENVKKHDEQSKDVQKYYDLIRFASYGQVVIFIGFMMILMVILLGIYNGRIALL